MADELNLEIPELPWPNEKTKTLLCLSLGKRDEAIGWLEQSVADPGPDNPYLRVHPFLDPLRGDPRFEALAEKVVPAREFRGSPK